MYSAKEEEEMKAQILVATPGGDYEETVSSTLSSRDWQQCSYEKEDGAPRTKKTQIMLVFLAVGALGCLLAAYFVNRVVSVKIDQKYTLQGVMQHEQTPPLIDVEFGYTTFKHLSTQPFKVETAHKKDDGALPAKAPVTPKKDEGRGFIVGSPDAGKDSPKPKNAFARREKLMEKREQERAKQAKNPSVKLPTNIVRQKKLYDAFPANKEASLRDYPCSFSNLHYWSSMISIWLSVALVGIGACLMLFGIIRQRKNNQYEETKSFRAGSRMVSFALFVSIGLVTTVVVQFMATTEAFKTVELLESFWLSCAAAACLLVAEVILCAM